MRLCVCVRVVAQPRLIQLHRETEVGSGILCTAEGTDRGLEALHQVVTYMWRFITLRFFKPLCICHCLAAQFGDGVVGIIRRGRQGLADSAA